MAAPFFDNISGTVTVAPAAAAFALNGAAAGASAWSTVPANQIVNYYAAEGTTWEEGIGLWNGTNLSRLLIDSSSGALISFGTGVVVSLVVPADEIAANIGGGKWGLWTAVTGATTATIIGLSAITAVGTAAAGAIGTAAGYLGRMHRVVYPSVTTANGVAGISWAGSSVYRSATAFMGGFEVVSRWGASTVPAAARLAVGLGTAALPATATEPSAALNIAQFAKDSTDTNIQFMVNNGAGAASKQDTGIPIVANAGYETKISCAPGSDRIEWMIKRLDTGVVSRGVALATKVPAADTALQAQIMGGLTGTTGTAFTMNVMSHYLKSSF